MTLTEKMMAPTPPKWKKWSILLKAISTATAIVAVAIPITAPVAGVIAGATGLASLYCSTKVDHDTIDALAAVVDAASQNIKK